MSEPLFSYQSVLKIPADDLASGFSHKSQLDDQIKQGLASLFPGGAKLDYQISGAPPEHLSATIIRDGQTITVTGRCGQNTVFTGGRKSSFISYSIRAELFSTEMNRADALGEQFSLFGKIIGAIAAPLPLLWAMFALANKAGLLVVWILPMVLAVFFGIWLGGKVGDSIARRLENRVHNQSVDSGAADETANLWKGLTNQLETISSRYEKV